MDLLTDKWKRRFLNIAKEISSWSKDPSTKTGAVIVDPRGRIVSLGYNGPPIGVKDTKERNERPTKYFFYEHAERNAIYLAGRNLDDHLLYCTHHPCADCARGIVQSGIKYVIIDTRNGGFGPGSIYENALGDNFKAAQDMLIEAGCNIHIYREDE